jgi:hypothetical protein
MYGRLLGAEGAGGRGQAREIVVEVDPGRGQVPVGAGRLPAEYDRHEQRLVAGGHGLVPDSDVVSSGGRTAEDLLGPGAVDYRRPVWSPSLGRPLLPSSPQGDRDRHGRGCAGRCAFRSAGCTQTVPGRPHRRGVPWTRCGFDWAVPTCLVGWSEPGNQAEGGDSW